MSEFVFKFRHFIRHIYLLLGNIYGSVKTIVPYWSVSLFGDPYSLLLEMTDVWAFKST
jgi:hypothetical protein